MPSPAQPAFGMVPSPTQHDSRHRQRLDPAVLPCNQRDACAMLSGGASAGVGPYVEVVFLHKQSKTLIVTDAVVCVPPSPPQVVRTANLLEAGSPLPGGRHVNNCSYIYIFSMSSVCGTVS